MRSALAVALANTERMGLDRFEPFNYGAPFSRAQLARWQQQLDREYPRGPRFARILIEYEPGDDWQPIGRLMLWQSFDPRYVDIEPWILRALQGPAPRSTGHYCGAGYCYCPLKRNRWHGGATKQVDMHTWRIYQQTGRYATRWWTIQGTSGGHRYAWDVEEAASVISQMKGGDRQPPAAGDLPFAPFDLRVIRAIRREHIIGRATMRLREMSSRVETLSRSDRDEAEKIAKALWDWTGQQAEDLWAEGAELLPRFFEEKYGRAPVGHKVTTDYDAIEERALTVSNY